MSAKLVGTVQRWGNSLAVRLPAAIARRSGLAEGSEVVIEGNAAYVSLVPVHNKPLTLSDRLAQYDPARHGGEEMAWAPVGLERLDSAEATSTSGTTERKRKDQSA